MIAKKPTIAAKPRQADVDAFLSGAAQNLDSARPAAAEPSPAPVAEKPAAAAKEDSRKRQFPIMIEPKLIEEFDAVIAELDVDGDGPQSRSYWIRKLIRQFVRENRGG